MATVDDAADSNNHSAEGAVSPPTQDILRLAQRVAAAGERAHLYEGESNSLAGWCSIEEAVSRRAAFAVNVRGDLVACDLDTEHEQSQAEHIRRFLGSVGLKPVVVASGRPGGMHLFVWVPNPPLRQAVRAEVARLCGSRAPIKTSMRPPLSPHRKGLPVRLLEPSTTTEALQRLPADPQRDDSRLSRRVEGLLAKGDLAGSYAGDRSAVEQAVLTEMVNRQWTSERAYRALTHRKNVGGEKTQELLASKGEAAARRYFYESWRAAEAFVEKSPAFADRHDAALALARHRVRVLEGRFPGRAGPALRALLLVLLDQAEALGSTRFRTSMRLLAERCGMSRTTVTLHLAALQDQGFVKVSNTGRGTQTSVTIRLNKVIETGPLPTYPLGGCESSGPVVSAAHDAFQHGGGLGPQGHQVLLALAQPCTIRELSEQTGAPVPTVRRILGRCARYGIASKVGETWVRSDGLLLTLALGRSARDAGTFGRGLRRREQHQLERLERSGQEPPLEPDDWCGWVDPITGAFTKAEPVESSKALGVGLVGDPVLSLRYEGHQFSVSGQDMCEIAWTTGARPKARSFPI